MHIYMWVHIRMDRGNNQRIPGKNGTKWKTLPDTRFPSLIL